MRRCRTDGSTILFLSWSKSWYIWTRGSYRVSYWWWIGTEWRFAWFNKNGLPFRLQRHFTGNGFIGTDWCCCALWRYRAIFKFVKSLSMYGTLFIKTKKLSLKLARNFREHLLKVTLVSFEDKILFRDLPKQLTIIQISLFEQNIKQWN